MKKHQTASDAVLASKRITDFAGADALGLRLTDMRVLPDGSLERREGFSHRCTLPGVPRAMLECAAGGFYALIGKYLYLADTDSGSVTRLAEVTASTGEAAIFRFGGSIFLLDGTDLWRYDNGTVISEQGYAPLYGRNWNPLSRGSINEPLNLLTRKVRIHYRVSEETTRLVTGIKLESIDSFELNGEVREFGEGTTWYLGDNGSYIRCTTLLPEDSVIICATVSEDEFDRSALAVCTRAGVFSDGAAETVCLFGGTEPALIFLSRYVSVSELDEAHKAIPTSGELYFPANGIMTVGDGKAAVRQVCSVGGDALLVTDAAVYRFVRRASLPPRAEPIDTLRGIDRGRAAAFGDGMLGVFENDICIWRGNSVGKRISDATLTEHVADITDACACPAHDEVWFCEPSSEDGGILVYDHSADVFCRFTEAYADRLLRIGSDMGFLRGKEVYLFDRALDVDILSDGTEREIVGVAESAFIDFGIPDVTKRLHRVSADVRGGEVLIELTADAGRKAARAFDGKHVTDGAPTYRSARANIGRFGSLRYRASTDGDGLPRIRGIELAVKK